MMEIIRFLIAIRIAIVALIWGRKKMKLIIDIPEEDYKFIKDLQFYHSGRRNGRLIEFHVINGIRNGKPYEERQRGEWIKGREISRTMVGPKVQHIDYKDYTCSNCGLVLDNLLYHHDGSLFYNFCPNCGADMRGDRA